jgi:hypothetical protein
VEWAWHIAAGNALLGMLHMAENSADMSREPAASRVRLTASAKISWATGWQRLQQLAEPSSSLYGMGLSEENRYGVADISPKT